MARYTKQKVRDAWRGQEVKVRAKVATGRTMWEVGLIVEGQAKLLCAIDTGRLAASITTQANDRGTVPTGPGARPDDVIQKPSSDREVLIGTPVEYGPYIEFGTVRNRAQPFLRPALDLAKGRTLTILEKNGRLEFKEYLQ